MSRALLGLSIGCGLGASLGQHWGAGVAAVLTLLAIVAILIEGYRATHPRGLRERKTHIRVPSVESSLYGGWTKPVSPPKDEDRPKGPSQIVAPRRTTKGAE
jgi:hypothetical protein